MQNEEERERVVGEAMGEADGEGEKAAPQDEAKGERSGTEDSGVHSVLSSTERPSHSGWCTSRNDPIDSHSPLAAPAAAPSPESPARLTVCLYGAVAISVS